MTEERKDVLTKVERRKEGERVGEVSGGGVKG